MDSLRHLIYVGTLLGTRTQQIKGPGPAQLVSTVRDHQQANQQANLCRLHDAHDGKALKELRLESDRAGDRDDWDKVTAFTGHKGSQHLSRGLKGKGRKEGRQDLQKSSSGLSREKRAGPAADKGGEGTGTEPIGHGEGCGLR